MDEEAYIRRMTGQETPNDLVTRDREKTKNNKKTISEIHRYSPKYVFLTETASTPPGYFIKEALKKAYPTEPLPQFYRIDPRQVQSVMQLGKNILSGKGTDSDRTSFEAKRKELEDFFKKRIKDRDANVLVYDQDWFTGGSPGSILALLKYPEQYGFDKDIKTRNVKINLNNHGDNNFDPALCVVQSSNKPENRYLLPLKKEDILPIPPLKMTYEGKPLVKKGSNSSRDTDNYNFRGTIIKDSLTSLREYKSEGARLGEELHIGGDKKKKLEKIVSGILVIGGFLGSLFFIGSNVTGNVIFNLSTKTTSFLGAGLFTAGLVAGYFWIKMRKS